MNAAPDARLDLDAFGLTVLHDGPLADCIVPEERDARGRSLSHRSFEEGDLVHLYECRAGGA